MFNTYFTIYGLLIDWSTYDIFENQFHLLKLCFHMFNNDFIYNLRF